jgi:putative restriction endonuclease
MKAVFDTKPTSIYDDDITAHYQFPRRYLSAVGQCIDDWIVFRRPRADGGNLAYFATAKVVGVDTDENSSGMSYARLAQFLPFDEPVPWTALGRYAEEALRNMPRAQVGVYLRGRSIRPLSETDFRALITVGLKRTLDPENAARLNVPQVAIQDAMQTAQSSPAGERDWKIETVLTNRIVREASFRGNVYDAYENRCAVTRLRIVDGKNSEVHAAHIWPVAEGGPDVVQNGIALSATIHWLFDRHLISLTDDYRLLVHRNVPGEIQVLFPPRGDMINLPSDPKCWPHRAYLERHRESFFKARDDGA